jgi:hypothetical protein
MAYKTIEEMFGDDAGFGAAVPYSITNPAGTGAGNRGIQFGESLTAAIANRTHYALALNTDDLHDRLSVFEVGGLDACYDNGLVGPAGGGRVIEKDSGAVETQSASASILGDLAHFRADARADTVASSVGFDFVSQRAASDGQAGEDAVAGFLDRRVFAKSSGYTQLIDDNAATLNPGGALVTTVRLTTGQFHSSGNTDLLLHVDLLEVSGSPSGIHDGLYKIQAVTGPDTDCRVWSLNDVSASFTANTACTIRVYRMVFGSWGPYIGSSWNYNRGAAAVGFQGGAAMTLIAGQRSSEQPTGGSDTALRARYWSTDSVDYIDPFRVDYLGRVRTGELRWEDIETDVERDSDLGAYGFLHTYSDAADVGAGYVAKANVTLGRRYDHLSLFPSDPPLTPSLFGGVTMTFVAASPVTGEVRFNVGQDVNVKDHVFGVGMFLELEGYGLFAIRQRTTTGNGGFLLRRADGTVPTHFPTAGTVTMTAIYTSSGVGRYINFLNADELWGSGTVTTMNVFSSTEGGETDGAAITLWSANNLDGGTRAFVRMLAADAGGAQGYTEKGAVSADGDLYLAGDVVANGDISTPFGDVGGTTFSYTSGYAKDWLLPLTDGLSETVAGVATWDFNSSGTGAPQWEARSGAALLRFPLRIPNNCTIRQVSITVKPNSGTVATGDRLTARLARLGNVASLISAQISTFTILATEYTDSTADLQVLHLDSAINSGAGYGADIPVAITSDTDEYFLYVYSSATGTGDAVHAVSIELGLTSPSYL